MRNEAKIGAIANEIEKLRECIWIVALSEDAELYIVLVWVQYAWYKQERAAFLVYINTIACLVNKERQ